ncbi:hypothetical protein KPH14_004474, partial [Odynerus spinipes]
IYVCKSSLEATKMDPLKKPALYVGDIDMNELDLQQPPTSGEDYIKRVVLEAKQYADVVVADIDPEHLRTPTIDIEPLPGCVEAPPLLSPTIEWQQRQVVDFSDLRLYVGQLKDQIQTSKHKWKSQQISLPSIDDRCGWITYCCEKRSDDDEIYSPTLKIMFHMNQPLVEQVLEYLVELVQTQGKIEYRLGQWLYALLVVLELPLNPDMCSCLRSLARACSVIRANSKKLEEHEIGALNLFICLVARYFRQMDLADP